MKLLLLLLLTILAIFYLVSDFNIYEVKKKGKLVEMEIVEKSRFCFNKTRSNIIRLRYNDNMYWSLLTVEECEKLKIGDKFSVLYLKGKEDVARINEPVIKEMISTILLYITLVYGIFKFTKW